MAVSRRKKALREQQLKAQSLELRREKLFASKETKRVFKEYQPSTPYYRETPNYASGKAKSTTHGAKAEAKVYTGDYITGLATMHKSNIVPVGRGDDPKNYATMRRN